MLSETELLRLRTHVIGICQSVILPEITSEGCILATDQSGGAIPDPVATHHLVELCLELAPGLTKEIVDRACDWFGKSNGGLNDPFFITTLVRANRLTEADRKLVLDRLQQDARPGGFIDLYAGFLDGGSIFSTLWAIRIAQLSRSERLDFLRNAYRAIESHWADIHRSSFKGFLAELIWMGPYRDELAPLAQRCVSEILNEQKADGFWDDTPFYSAYVIGNLLSEPDTIGSASIVAAERGLRRLFSLEKDATTLPDSIAEARKTYVNSAYLQICLRSALSAARYLNRIGQLDVTPDLGRALIGFLPRVYQTARQLDAQLKLMNSQYGQIKAKFDHLQKNLVETVLAKSAYDRNVFIMMPFRHKTDERYETVVRVIKQTLKKKGFTGWLAADASVNGQLWDNVVSFMLACKFGIAVFTRTDDPERGEIRTKEFNPNVSLELGFFLSRGKDVLILKDKPLPNLQTDLVGHLYTEFDLSWASRTLPPCVMQWVDGLLEQEKALAKAAQEAARQTKADVSSSTAATDPREKQSKKTTKRSVGQSRRAPRRKRKSS